jgi:hypothetical protein
VAIAFVNSGAGAVGSGSLTIPFPSPVTAGNILVATVVNKYPNNAPTTPSGWKLQKQTGGGAGASGADIGNVYSSVYTKRSDGTETGNLTVTITAGNSAIGRIWQYSVAALSGWDMDACSGTYAAGAGAAWSVTGDSDVGVAADDFVIAVSAINTDLYSFTAEAVTQTGVTFGAMNERADNVTTNGDDCAIVVADFPVTAGTSSAAPVYTMTSSGTATSNPAGATVLLRLREVLPLTADVGTFLVSGQDLTFLGLPAPTSGAPVDNVGGRGPRAYVRHASKSSKWPWQKRPKGLFRGH